MSAQLRREFDEYHAANPQVYELVCRFASEAWKHGYRRFAIATIWERIRWEIAMTIDSADGPRFKLPNNHRAYYARLWLERHPKAPQDFFRTSQLRSETDATPDRFGEFGHDPVE